MRFTKAYAEVRWTAEQRWTPELDAKLREQAPNGPAAVVEATGKTIVQARARAYALGIAIAPSTSWKAWTKPQLERLAELWKKGTSLKEMAKETGRSEGAVKDALRRAGLRRTRDEAQELIQIRRHEEARPKTRGDCIDGPRPCKWNCKWRLHKGPDSCALDVADRVSIGHEFTLEQVGKAIGVTRERARQIQDAALIKLRDQFAEQLGMELDTDEVAAMLGAATTDARRPRSEQLTDARARAGLTRKQAADLAGVSAHSLEKYETGRKRVPTEVFTRVMAALRGSAEMAEAAE